MKCNVNINKLPANYLFADIAERVKKHLALHPDSDLIRMGIGDVTRPLSDTVAREMAAAALGMAKPEGFHGYPPDYGYDFLINAIREKDYAPHGVSLDYDEVFISDGAKPDSANLQELFSQDTVIAVTDPVYPVYVDSNAMSGRLGAYRDGQWSGLICLPCVRENGFIPPLPDRHVDVLYLCYPNNPTGTALTRDQLKPFVDWALENDSLIVFDAAYKAYITQDDIPYSIYEIPGAKECAVECCSFSKFAGFTGVRCGYMIIPKGVTASAGNERVSLNRLWKRRTSTKSNGVSYPVQRAAAAVFTDTGYRETMENVSYYLNNARILLDGLKKAGFEVYGGLNSPYVWLKTPGDTPSWDFFDLLLTQLGIVSTPGKGFGPSGEGYIRLTAFNTAENTSEAIRRLHSLF